MKLDMFDALSVSFFFALDISGKKGNMPPCYLMTNCLNLKNCHPPCMAKKATVSAAAAADEVMVLSLSDPF